MSARRYSDFFSCIHDEPEPVGRIGRGCHYSILRCAEWYDVTRRPLVQAQRHDFAVIWDEDHDTRVIDVVEQFYMAGLLSPVQFIGERKAHLTVVLAAKFYFLNDEGLDRYQRQLKEVVSRAVPDTWEVSLGTYDRSGPHHQTDLQGLIQDSVHRADTYVRSIDHLWSLGTYPYKSGT